MYGNIQVPLYYTSPLKDACRWVSGPYPWHLGYTVVVPVRYVYINIVVNYSADKLMYKNRQKQRNLCANIMGSVPEFPFTYILSPCPLVRLLPEW
jgi:hypothetical protein